MPKDLHILPKLRDSLTFLYVEHATIEQDSFSIVKIDKDGRTPIPIAAVTVLMIGPGVTITHAAVKAICDNGCMAVWCGERAAKFYACGTGETRSAENLLRQAELCMDTEKHMEVVRRMYLRRFPDIKCDGMALQQIRGLEGIRMREAYRTASKMYGIPWSGRNYSVNNWDDSNPINKALSMANSILYSVCHAAIISLGYSTGLGFIHTGKMLSFVYDMADLYKAETSIPAAFAAVKSDEGDLERRVRIACRQEFRNSRLLARVPEDIEWIFMIKKASEDITAPETGDIWDGDARTIAGGKNHADESG